MVVMCDLTKELQLNKERNPYWSHTGSEIMLGKKLKYSATILNRRNEILQTKLENSQI